MSHHTKYEMADLLLQHELDQFYYREAAMLDMYDFDSWLGLLHEELRYWMPIRSNRILRDRSMEYTADNETAHFDESYAMIQARIRKLKSDVGWSENPASRTRHIVSNVMVNSEPGSDVLSVSSSFLVYRNKLERQVDIFAGRRDDELIRSSEGGSFKIRNRTIYIDQTTILSNNLSFFF